MERQFIPPTLLPLLSKTLGNLIILLAGLFYVGELVKKPFEQTTGTILTAFGIIAGFSALCYTAIPSYRRDQRGTPLYAGEKFLHSSLLIIQTLFLRFALVVFLDGMS
jgi:hypothetical protein